MRSFSFFVLSFLFTAPLAEAASLRVLLESNDDRVGGQEIFLTSFDTFDALINSTSSGGTGAFSGINIASGYSVGGFAYEYDNVVDPPPPAVPLPASIGFLFGALGLLIGLKRRV